MLKIEISKKAEKFIRKLPPKQARQVAAKILELRYNPEPHDSILLKGHKKYRRTDIGEYRIVYLVRELIVLIMVLVDKRNDDDVYKKLKRL